MNKEEISERLKSEHNIQISSATVGRTILRHGFFYADTASHRRKRAEEKRRVNTETYASDYPIDTSGSDDEPFLEELSLHPTLSLLVGLASAALLTLPGSVDAAESTSFVLEDNSINYATDALGTSTSFQTAEGGTTWLAVPLSSSSFQMITAPGTIGSGGTGGSDGGGTGGGTGGGSTGGESSGGGRGGRRGSGGPPAGHGTTGGVASAGEDTHAAAPSDRKKETVTVDAFQETEFSLTQYIGPPSMQEVAYPRREKLIPFTHYFAITDAIQPPSDTGMSLSIVTPYADLLYLLDGYRVSHRNLMLLHGITFLSLVILGILFIHNRRLAHTLRKYRKQT